MMVETSALCSILLEEADWQRLTDQIDAAPRPFTTPIAVFEAVMVI
jgi:uncharacterized protein with PIN domain